MNKTTEFLNLAEMPKATAQEYLKSGSIVYVFVNPVENHGPHLPLNTDFVISHGILKSLHAKLDPNGPALIYPPISLGANPAPGLGSAKTSVPDLIRILENVSKNLIQLNAKKVVFLTFHGDPLHNVAIQNAVNFLRARGVLAISPMNLLLEEMILDRPESVATKLRVQVDPNMGLDFHAGFFETSLVLHFAPEMVGNFQTLPACPACRPNLLLSFLSKVCFSVKLTRLARQLNFAAIAVTWQALTPHPGYSGRPDLASKEVGAILAQEIIEQYVNCVSHYFATHNSDFLNSVPMGWLYDLSFGGRII